MFSPSSQSPSPSPSPDKLLSQSLPAAAVHKQLRKTSSAIAAFSQPNTPDGPGLRKLALINQMSRSESDPVGLHRIAKRKELEPIADEPEPPPKESSPPPPPPLDPSSMETKTFSYQALQSLGDPFGKVDTPKEQGSPRPKSARSREKPSGVNQQMSSSNENLPSSTLTQASSASHLLNPAQAGPSHLSSASSESFLLKVKKLNSSSGLATSVPTFVNPLSAKGKNMQPLSNATSFDNQSDSQVDSTRNTASDTPIVSQSADSASSAPPANLASALDPVLSMAAMASRAQRAKSRVFSCFRHLTRVFSISSRSFSTLLIFCLSIISVFQMTPFQVSSHSLSCLRFCIGFI